PPNVASGMSGNGDSATAVERHPIGAGLRASVGCCACVPAGVHKVGRAFSRRPLVNLVGWNLSEQQCALAGPCWAFHPFVKTSGYTLEFGICRNNLIERRIEFLDFLGKNRNGQRS